MSGCSNIVRFSLFLACLMLGFSGVLAADNEASHPVIENPLVLKWKDLEPDLMEYKFDELLRKPLEAAYAQDMHLSLMIHVGPDCPIWLYYTRDVPRFYTDRKVDEAGKRVRRLDNRFPYYLDPIYKESFYDLINAFGTYVENLPLKLRERILYIQSCEGAASDTVPYKGNPEKEEFVISEEEWEEFRLQTWKLYKKNFPEIPILINTGDRLVGWAEQPAD